MAASRVLRRKLNRLETGPYQCALLRRGVTKKVDVEDERVPVLQQAMEYAGAVGMMVMDEVAYVHERTETAAAAQSHWGRRGIYPVGIV